MSTQPPQKPALATAGVSVGAGGGTLVLGLLVAKLTSESFTFAGDWQAVAGYFLALGALYGWAWLTARKESVQTGLSFFDRPKNGGGGG
jgi:hypothetical protein